MAGDPVRVVTIPARRTAVVVRATSWADFPALWPELLDQVYSFARHLPDIATGERGDEWQNVMLYKDDTPNVDVGLDGTIW